MHIRSFIQRSALIIAGTLVWACGGDPFEAASSATSTGTAGATGTGSGGQGGGTAPGASLPACTPDGGEEPPHTDIANGEYSVPVPPELELYASYPVDEVSLCRTGTGIELGYSLPALLVGDAQRVSFSGDFDDELGAFVLTSEDGTSTCDPSGAAWSCFEEFIGIEVDLERVAKEAEGLSATEAQARLEVATLFANDPIGLLGFSVP